jgi:hypothetical protein
MICEYPQAELHPHQKQMNSPIRPTTYRYTGKAFPEYAYVPGQTPHPTRDPQGHSYNLHPDDPESFDISDWQSCEEYLFGIDLFNHGYWWEAHESLEAVWHTAGRTTETGLFIQGLIQVAVAHLKRFQGFDEVSQRMADNGLEKMKHINNVYLGIDVPDFRKKVTKYFMGKSTTPVTIKLNNLEPLH